VAHLELEEAETVLSHKGQMLMILPKLSQNIKNQFSIEIFGKFRP
jgi:hypothetical protein